MTTAPQALPVMPLAQRPQESAVSAYPGGHILVIDDLPGVGGFRAVCTPHGLLGAWPSRAGAVLAALQHDYENGGLSTR